MHFLEWKCMNCDETFTEVCFWGSNKQYPIIGSDNRLAPTRWQAIIWTNDGSFTDAYMCYLTSIETFWNVTVTVTVRRVKCLWHHWIVCIWNAPNWWPNHKCQHMTVSGADNCKQFTVSGYAKFHQIFHENGIDLLHFNKQLSKCTTQL